MLPWMPHCYVAMDAAQLCCHGHSDSFIKVTVQRHQYTQNIEYKYCALLSTAFVEITQQMKDIKI